MLHRGDCFEVLKTLEENSIDSLVTDPPAGISFMNKEWDSGNNFIPAMTEIFKETLRVLKPGAHGLVWALPRTSHWTATALEQAGFEIRDVVTHLFGSGFPKSLDISKAIDKAAGAEREVVGVYQSPEGTTGLNSKDDEYGFGMGAMDKRSITAPTTDEAKQWQGWGTALKPASEHFILIRKPLSEKTVAANVLKWGTGGINIDDCRIEASDQSSLEKNWDRTQSESNKHGTITREGGDLKPIDLSDRKPQGRFPANLVLDEIAAEMLDEQSGVSKSLGGGLKNGDKFGGGYAPPGQPSIGFGDKGGASRFFYVAKASKKDRNEGCEDLPNVEGVRHLDGGPWLENKTSASGVQQRLPTKNHHPTVKSTKLMEYLITLITPPKGVVLDPFMGSGSTGKAAKRLGFEFIGIEKEEEYFKIAEARINA